MCAPPPRGGTPPRRGRARVLWLSVLGEWVVDLQRDVAARLEEIGHQSTDGGRAFHPHVTLGRARRGLSARAAAELLEPFVGLDGSTFPVPHGTLFESELLPSGARYSSRARFPMIDETTPPSS